MSWADVRALGIVLRPYDNPPESGGTPSPFDATLGATLDLLARELRALQAKNIVLQVGYRDRDLRADGLPRSNAKMLHGAVALSFESKWGPLRYETNEFVKRWYGSRGEGWEQNLRAIALGMEALRKVDRYGVSKRGEQYAGWRALPTMADADLPHDTPAALRAVHSVVEDLYDLEDVDGPHRAEAIREALRRSHPDHGGDSDVFRRVIAARSILA